MDYFKYAGGDTVKAGRRGGDNKRDKRLERNRESARKCRRKRKAYVGDLEEKCQLLAEENALLQLEKKRLQELIQQLQGNGTDSKRRKGENGVSMANDFSESAVPASTSPQLESFSLLAILTTFLLLLATWGTTSLLGPFHLTPTVPTTTKPNHPRVARRKGGTMALPALWMLVS
jgi:hypothetical protein